MLGLAAAALFVALAGPRLTAQGLNEDEASGCRAAAWAAGTPGAPESSSAPWMATSYEAAAKGTAYGLFLRVTGRRFSVRSWRLAGILVTAAALAAFPLLAGGSLSLPAQACFLLLVLSDQSVLLLSRHEYAPFSFAFLLRVIFVGLWLRQETRGDVSRAGAAALGLVAGLGVSEKLTFLALVPVIALLAARDPLRGRLGWLAAGAAAGLLPLALTNGLLLARGATAPLLLPVVSSYPSYGPLGFAARAASLAAGALLRQFILGEPVGFAAIARSVAEAALLGAVLAAVALPALRRRGGEDRGPARMAGGFALALAALFFLPRGTWAHHWIVATPLQYGAAAWALSTAVRGPRRAALAGGLALLLILRAAALVPLERALLRGEASRRWDPSLTDYARFAASRGDALFVAGTWGVSAAPACFQRGALRIVRAYDPLPTAEELARLADGGSARELYVAAKRFPTGRELGDVSRLLGRASSMDGWSAPQPGPSWPAVRTWKLARR